MNNQNQRDAELTALRKQGSISQPIGWLHKRIVNSHFTGPALEGQIQINGLWGTPSTELHFTPEEPRHHRMYWKSPVFLPEQWAQQLAPQCCNGTREIEEIARLGVEVEKYRTMAEDQYFALCQIFGEEPEETSFGTLETRIERMAATAPRISAEALAEMERCTAMALPAHLSAEALTRCMREWAQQPATAPRDAAISPNPWPQTGIAQALLHGPPPALCLNCNGTVSEPPLPWCKLGANHKTQHPTNRSSR